ncbi:MAG: AAA family ATPase [Phycisphaeraceae bacterium]|nr:AAA family ATPase [Phycisphaeraceae bacterium]
MARLKAPQHNNGHLPPPKPQADDRARPVLLNLADVKASPVRWLWRGRIPLGRITLLAGHPGCGKSFITCDLAARLSVGRAWPDGTTSEPGRTLLLSAEDDPADTVKPRLLAAGASCSMVDALTCSTFQGKERGVTLADLDVIEDALRRHDDYRLLVIDPIGSYLGGGVDSYKDNETRAVLAPLAKLAADMNLAVLLVAHTRKAQVTRADDSVLGSRAFTGLARSVLHLAEDPETKARKLLLPGKCNLGPPCPGLAFTIEGDPATILWEPFPLNLHADDLLAASHGGEAGRTERDDAGAWLLDLLAAGPRRARDVEEEARDAGYSLATLRRAKAATGVVARKSAFGGPWEWAVPAQDAHPPPKALTSENVSALGERERLGSWDDEWGAT